MSRVLTINTWIGIRNGCSMGCQTLGTDDIEFTIGGGGLAPFEIVFDVAALTEFVELGIKALGKLSEDSTKNDSS